MTFEIAHDALFAQLANEVTLVGVVVDPLEIGVSKAPTLALFTKGLLPTIKTSIFGKPNTPGLKKCTIDLLVSGHENDPSSKDLQGTKARSKKNHKPNEPIIKKIIATRAKHGSVSSTDKHPC